MGCPFSFFSACPFVLLSSHSSRLHLPLSLPFRLSVCLCGRLAFRLSISLPASLPFRRPVCHFMSFVRPIVGSSSYGLVTRQVSAGKIDVATKTEHFLVFVRVSRWHFCFLLPLDANQGPPYSIRQRPAHPENVVPRDDTSKVNFATGSEGGAPVHGIRGSDELPCGTKKHRKSTTIM